LKGSLRKLCHEDGREGEIILRKERSKTRKRGRRGIGRARIRGKKKVTETAKILF